jgi:cell division protein FtsA
MAPKEIAVKNLANIIQARMSEIMDFVTYHLKQVGLDSRSLNGGIILTGGGSQLKHLLQLTEFLTGLNARIGYPNEHLSGDHLEELEKPMYSTCIGLILKGYNDYENKHKSTVAEEVPEKSWKKVTHTADVQIEIEEPVMETPAVPVDQEQKTVVVRKKSLKKFLDSIKTDIINLFQEEDDKNFEEFKNQ